MLMEPADTWAGAATSGPADEERVILWMSNTMDGSYYGWVILWMGRTMDGSYYGWVILWMGHTMGVCAMEGADLC